MKAKIVIELHPNNFFRLQTEIKEIVHTMNIQDESDVGNYVIPRTSLQRLILSLRAVVFDD